MKKVYFGIFIFLLLQFSACKTADGSAIITGTPRAPITIDEVKLYSVFPENYEIIAIINASSDWGFTAQENYDYAIEELKNQAAKIGANGIVIESMGETKKTIPMLMSNGIGGFYTVPISGKENSVTGKAIFVLDDKE